MLPLVDALFTLVRQLATRSPVTEIAAPKWLVQRHGLAAMAARAGAASYRDDLVRATVDWARIEHELPPIMRRLSDSGIRVAPIKGVAYAKTLYATPAERPMADVDVLVQSAQQDRAETILIELGFERGPSAVLHHARPWIRHELVIDLHRSIIAPGRSRIDHAAVWSRTTPGWPEPAEQLDPVDALVFHLVNLARNRLRAPLVAVIDAARLIERLPVRDTNPVLERARDWGLEAAARIALRFCTAIIENREGRPAGWLGPSLDDVATLADQGVTTKILFDVATAGSPTQLASRVVHFGANQLRKLTRRA